MTSNLPSSPVGETTWRRVIVALVALAGVVITFNLGQWQLSRAQEKLSLQARIEAQALLAPLSAQDFQQDAALWQQVHRPVLLEGEWLSAQSIYLDNRNHHGQSGFWVMTPLRWAPGQVVWVQRGWVQRDFVDARKLPRIETPLGQVKVQGRVAAPLSHMVELATTSASVQTLPRIQANLDPVQMQAMVTDNVSGIVIQTGDTSEGLRRDWSVVASSADKNKGYAFQWFALSALMAGLYLWFQWIQPLKYAKQKT